MCGQVYFKGNVQDHVKNLKPKKVEAPKPQKVTRAVAEKQGRQKWAAA